MSLSRVIDRRMVERWIYVAWFDFVVSYRKTTLGPFWLLVTPFLFIAVIGWLYSRVNSMDPEIFVPYLAVGIVVWTLISGFVNKSTTVFQSNRPQILQGSMSLIDIVMVRTITTALEFAHQIIIIIVVLIFFRVSITLYSLISVIGLGIVIANGFWITMTFGIVGARYRDLSQITAAIMRIAFLATPIIWFAYGGAKGKFLGVFLLLNPFYHFLEIVRAPLLGYPIEATTWIAVLLITAGGFGLTMYLYKRYSSLVPLWV
jgi:ABC-type polysaccharide/polyol phosphate export permease